MNFGKFVDPVHVVYSVNIVIVGFGVSFAIDVGGVLTDGRICD